MKLSIPTLLLGVALPLATAFVIALLLAAGGIEQIGAVPDLLVYVLELAVRTIYAMAVFGAAALAMRWTGLDHSNDALSVLWARSSLNGGSGLDSAARWTIALQAACWVAMLILSIVVFRGLG